MKRIFGPEHGIFTCRFEKRRVFIGFGECIGMVYVVTHTRMYFHTMYFFFFARALSIPKEDELKENFSFVISFPFSLFEVVTKDALKYEYTYEVRIYLYLVPNRKRFACFSRRQVREYHITSTPESVNRNVMLTSWSLTLQELRVRKATRVLDFKSCFRGSDFSAGRKYVEYFDCISFE